jgi:chromosome segregation ATPase
VKFRKDIRELFVMLGFNSKLFERIIDFPYFYHLRFRFNISWKYCFGTIKRLLFVFVFMKDIIGDIYNSYYKYREAINDYNKNEIESKSLITRVELTQAQIEQTKVDARTKVEKARENYTRSNNSFFTLILAIVAILVTSYFYTVNINNKEENISELKNTNQTLVNQNNELQKQIDDLKSSLMQAKSDAETLEQDSINESIAEAIGKLTNILEGMSK